MKLLQTTALCVALPFAATPTLADGKAFSELKVDVDLGDFANSNALDFYPNLEFDIERAIADRIELTSDLKDPRVDVNIHKIAVDGDTILPDTMEFNQIEGSVTVFEGTAADQNEDSAQFGPIASKTIKLSARTADTIVPEGWVVVSPSQEDFYDAMIGAFADYAVDFLEETS